MSIRWKYRDPKCDLANDLCIGSIYHANNIYRRIYYTKITKHFGSVSKQFAKNNIYVNVYPVHAC